MPHRPVELEPVQFLLGHRHRLRHDLMHVVILICSQSAAETVDPAGGKF